ncbi:MULTISPECIES: RHS repeat domain-containing protein, partial [unclassified Myroides]|uniref:RHS repeat domain-containing protein n=1 Tax=unclassified Myroides TaxID=2642485 RepID=UPI003D2F6E1E
DYIGRPIQAYSEEGALVWSTDYDIYGKLRNLVGDRMFIPFRQLGQYEDIELDGLYYNRFRYYDSNSGLYIAKDPIGLAGNNPTFYAYVWDSNGEVDVFGLFEIALGLNPHNYNLADDLTKGKNGFNAVLEGVFADGDWDMKKAGISLKPITPKNFVSEFEKAVKKADVIHFNVSGINFSKSSKAGLIFDVDNNGILRGGDVTDVELNRILNDSTLFAKTRFYDLDPKTGNYFAIDKNKVKQKMGYK